MEEEKKLLLCTFVCTGKLVLPNFSPTESEYYSKLVTFSRVHIAESEPSDGEVDTFTDKTHSPSDSLTTSLKIGELPNCS